MNKLLVFYEWAHAGKVRTWGFHCLQAFLIAAVTFIGMAVLPGDYPLNLRLGVGTYAALAVFAHREASDIIPVLLSGERPTEKLIDGFGDFWSVPIGVSLFALLVGAF